MHSSPQFLDMLSFIMESKSPFSKMSRYDTPQSNDSSDKALDFSFPLQSFIKSLLPHLLLLILPISSTYLQRPTRCHSHRVLTVPCSSTYHTPALLLARMLARSVRNQATTVRRNMYAHTSAGHMGFFIVLVAEKPFLAKRLITSIGSLVTTENAQRVFGCLRR